MFLGVVVLEVAGTTATWCGGSFSFFVTVHCKLFEKGVEGI